MPQNLPPPLPAKKPAVRPKPKPKPTFQKCPTIATDQPISNLSTTSSQKNTKLNFDIAINSIIQKFETESKSTGAGNLSSSQQKYRPRRGSTLEITRRKSIFELPENSDVDSGKDLSFTCSSKSKSKEDFSSATEDEDHHYQHQQQTSTLVRQNSPSVPSYLPPPPAPKYNSPVISHRFTDRPSASKNLVSPNIRRRGSLKVNEINTNLLNRSRISSIESASSISSFSAQTQLTTNQLTLTKKLRPTPPQLPPRQNSINGIPTKFKVMMRRFKFDGLDDLPVPEEYKKIECKRFLSTLTRK